MAAKDQKEFIKTKAYELFYEKGYYNVTVNDICNACGITKPTFYYYLKSKEDIIIDFYDGVVDKIVHRFIDNFDTNNYWDQLMLCFETIADESLKLGSDLNSQLFIINLKESKKSFDFRDQLTKLAVKLVEKGQKAGQIRNQSAPDLLYHSSAYAFLGYELHWCMKKGQFEWKRQMRVAMENIYDVIPELRICNLKYDEENP